VDTNLPPSRYSNNISKTEQETFSPNGGSENVSFVLERRELSERAKAAWTQFWNILISECEKEMADETFVANDREVENNGCMENNDK
jgi:hypothetical protein